MKIDVLTLFPEMYDGVLNSSIIKRARENNLVEINVHNIRDFTLDKHNRVDDYPIGGGEGMVLMPEPIYRAINHFKDDDSIVIMMTPQGKTYNQKMAYEFKNYKHIILLCGHYEGFDERIRSFVDMEVSIGDYVLTGGELASMVMIDSITRLIDGVIEKDSHINDSFNNNLLDYPVYTKPIDFMGMKVPDILLSGHHEKINKWRYEEQIKKTKLRRPDLLEKSDDLEK
ncbi:MAG: tRNA (guanosine(37)-N1)-methyltransferase TrmD [Bacilli bacterium]|nr:tRNA (guanosine(37)-N1)-methyltransferase TrmD [Bacilli bacterium]